MLKAPALPTEPSAPHRHSGSLLGVLGAVYIFTSPLDFVPSPVGTPATVAGLLFLIQWLVELAAGSAVLPPRALAVPLIGAFTAWNAVTTTWSINSGIWLGQTLTVAFLGLSVFAIAGTFRSSVRRPAWALMLGAGVAAVAALLSGPPARPYGYVSEQATFLGIDPNVLSFHLCLGLAASYFLIGSETRLIRRATSLVLALLLTASILAVGSRTGGGAFILTTLVFAVLSAKSVRTAIASGVLVLALVWVFRAVADAGVLPERLAGWYRAPVLTDQRSVITAQFWELRNEWILKGVGAGADADYLLARRNWYVHAHSAFWKTWIELGIVGLLLWIGIVFNFIYHAAKSADRLLFILAAPTIAAFFYTLGPVNSNALWALIGLALGSRRQMAPLAQV